MSLNNDTHTTVYRVENDVDGYGPYRSPLIPENLLEAMHNKHSAYVSASHPVPHRDGLTESKINLMFGDCWTSGCKDMNQLKEWFGEFLTPLMQNGFTIKKYLVKKDRVLYGDHQVVFNPSEAEKVQALKLYKTYTK